MRKFITSVSFTRVPKMAFAPLVNNLVGIVEKHDPVALKIDGMFQLVLDVVPELDHLQNTYSEQDKTELLNQLLQRRRTLLVAILGQSRMTDKASVEAEEAHRTIALPFIHKHLKNILDATTDVQTGMINDMFKDMEGNEVLDAALVALGWKACFEELKSLKVSIAHIGSLRRQGKANSPDVKTDLVKSIVSDALTDLLNRIESAQKEYKTINYWPLIKELNTELVPVAAKMKARATRSKNAQDAARNATNTSTDSTKTGDNNGL